MRMRHAILDSYSTRLTLSLSWNCENVNKLFNCDPLCVVVLSLSNRHTNLSARVNGHEWKICSSFFLIYWLLFAVLWQLELLIIHIIELRVDFFCVVCSSWCCEMRNLRPERLVSTEDEGGITLDIHTHETRATQRVEKLFFGEVSSNTKPSASSSNRGNGILSLSSGFPPLRDSSEMLCILFRKC